MDASDTYPVKVEGRILLAWWPWSVVAMPVRNTPGPLLCPDKQNYKFGVPQNVSTKAICTLQHIAGEEHHKQKAGASEQ